MRRSSFASTTRAAPPPRRHPTRLEIRSTAPLKVVLKEHEIQPRDPAGKALQWTSALVSKVADVASVSVDFTATHATQETAKQE